MTGAGLTGDVLQSAESGHVGDSHQGTSSGSVDASGRKKISEREVHSTYTVVELKRSTRRIFAFGFNCSFQKANIGATARKMSVKAVKPSSPP